MTGLSQITSHPIKQTDSEGDIPVLAESSLSQTSLISSEEISLQQSSSTPSPKSKPSPTPSSTPTLVCTDPGAFAQVCVYAIANQTVPPVNLVSCEGKEVLDLCNTSFSLPSPSPTPLNSPISSSSPIQSVEEFQQSWFTDSLGDPTAWLKQWNTYPVSAFTSEEIFTEKTELSFSLKELKNMEVNASNENKELFLQGLAIYIGRANRLLQINAYEVGELQDLKDLLAVVWRNKITHREVEKEVLLTSWITHFETQLKHNSKDTHVTETVVRRQLPPSPSPTPSLNSLVCTDPGPFVQVCVPPIANQTVPLINIQACENKNILDLCTTLTPSPSPTPTPTSIPAVTVSLADLSSTSSGFTMGLGVAQRASDRRAKSDTELGYAVATGDVNGDGRADSVIAANTGEIFVVYGSDTPKPYTDLRADADVTITDIPGNTDNTLSTGDVNGDNVDDIVVGIPKLSKAIVLFGSDSLPSSIDGNHPNVTITAKDSKSQLGASLQVTDVTGDNIDDILTCAPNANTGAGQCIIVPGSKNLRTKLSTKDALVTFNGSPTSPLSKIASGGDVNKDGRNDVLLGTPNADSYAGGGYLCNGPFTSTQPTINVTQCAFSFNGKTAGDKAGETLALGDLNEDGYADMIIASPGADRGKGTVSVVLGKKTMPSSLHLNSANIQYTGASRNGKLGTRIVITDLNGNGLNDLLMSAPGVSRVFGFVGDYGPLLQPGLTPTSVSVSTAQLTISGDSDNTGAALAASPDNDANRGILIGAPSKKGHTGMAYKVFLPIPALYYFPPKPTPTPTPIRKHEHGGEGEGEGESKTRNIREYSGHSALNDNFPTSSAAVSLKDDNWVEYTAKTVRSMANYVFSFFGGDVDSLSEKSSLHSAHSRENRDIHQKDSLRKIQVKINALLLLPEVANNREFKAEVLNYQMQINTLKQRLTPLKTTELEDLRSSIERLEDKVHNPAPNSFNGISRFGLFASTTLLTPTPLPTLDASTNLTLSNK